MLRLTAPCAISCRLFRRQYKIESACRKSLSLASFVLLLTLVSQQPAGGQQSNGETEPTTIESRAYYSFSAAESTVEQLGVSQNVSVDRIEPQDDNLSAQTSNSVNAADVVEQEPVVESTVGIIVPFQK